MAAALGASKRRRWQSRRGLALQVGQFVHVVVERLELSHEGIAQQEVKAAFFGLAGEYRDAHVHGILDLQWNSGQHRQAT